MQAHGVRKDYNGTTWVDRTNYYETLPANDENLDSRCDWKPIASTPASFAGRIWPRK